MPVTEYNIWKREGGYSGTRYYESEKQFKRHGLRKSDGIYAYKAYRFTSKGWKEIQ